MGRTGQEGVIHQLSGGIDDSVNGQGTAFPLGKGKASQMIRPLMGLVSVGSAEINVSLDGRESETVTTLASLGP